MLLLLLGRQKYAIALNQRQSFRLGARPLLPRLPRRLLLRVATRVRAAAEQLPRLRTSTIRMAMTRAAGPTLALDQRSSCELLKARLIDGFRALNGR